MKSPLFWGFFIGIFFSPNLGIISVNFYFSEVFMDRIKPSVLVTGASGFIGCKLISSIAPDCRSVVSMYRQRLPEPLDNVFPVCNDLRSSRASWSSFEGN